MQTKHYVWLTAGAVLALALDAQIKAILNPILSAVKIVYA